MPNSVDENVRGVDREMFTKQGLTVAAQDRRSCSSWAPRLGSSRTPFAGSRCRRAPVPDVNRELAEVGAVFDVFRAARDERSR